MPRAIILAAFALVAGLAHARPVAHVSQNAGDHRAVLRAALTLRASSCVVPKLKPWAPDPARDDGWFLRDSKTLSKAEGKALSTALALAKPAKAGPIAAAWLPKGARLGENQRLCQEVLTFSEPAIFGDMGFIESSSFCGPLCGSGMIHAFRKVGGRWVQAGLLGTWIS